LKDHKSKFSILSFYRKKDEDIIEFKLNQLEFQMTDLKGIESKE